MPDTQTQMPELPESTACSIALSGIPVRIEGYYTAAQMREYGLACVALSQQADTAAQAVAWLPMETAPRDGTMLRLLVQFNDNATEDTTEPCATIGTNTFDHSELDEWKFAGWNWQQDCFTEGKGTPVGWLPLLDAAPVPAQQPEAAQPLSAIEQRTEDIRLRLANPTSIPRSTLLHYAECLLAHIALMRPAAASDLPAHPKEPTA